MDKAALRNALEDRLALGAISREEFDGAMSALEHFHAPAKDRRHTLLAGMGLALGALLTGCASGGKGNNIAMRWPDQEPSLGKLKPVPTAPTLGSTPRTSPPTMAAGVIPRSRWATQPPKWSLSKPLNGISRITVHHDAFTSVGLSSERSVATRIESIRRAHRQRGSEWVDIGYHYIIDPSGRVWEGRPITIEGAHVSKTNEHNLGICVLGNFDEQRPTSDTLNTLDSFVAYQARLHRVSMRNVFTHQELKPTACPGRNLQKYMLETRSGRGRMATA
jgi:hypothetical protein